MEAFPNKLWVETPLVHSPHVSSRLGCDVYLKLESCQTSQSFKYRGISHFIQEISRTRGPDVRVVIASSGSAGLAAACASKALGLRCTVYLPESASTSIVKYMKMEGAEVVTTPGKFYPAALAQAELAVAQDPNAVLVSPYNHPLVWEGHSSIVHEIARQLPSGTKPDAIFASVGGGGLFGGVMLGCQSAKWDDVPCIALETTGSDCFHQSLELNLNPSAQEIPGEGVEALYDPEHDVMLAHLGELRTRASSLGATSPAPGVVRMALDRSKTGLVKSVCVPDEFAMAAALRFADEHKMLVELATATTLTPAHSTDLFRRLVPSASNSKPQTVVFILCGGLKISLAEISEYETVVREAVSAGECWNVQCDSQRWDVATRIG